MLEIQQRGLEIVLASRFLYIFVDNEDYPKMALKACSKIANRMLRRQLEALQTVHLQFVPRFLGVSWVPRKILIV